MTQQQQKVKIINLVRSRGDTDDIKFRMTDKKKNGLDITSNTFILSVSNEESPTGSTYVFQSTGALDDAFDGKFSFPITGGDEDNVGIFYYDVQRTYGGVVKTIIKGKLEFEQDITK